MTSSAPRPERARVAVFAKAPVPGAVKTRLAGVLGPEGAASLHAALVRHALDVARRAQLGAVELWCAPDTDHEFFVACAAAGDVVLRRQEGEDLGTRMRHACDTALADGFAPIVIGSDCPALAPQDLVAAAGALRTHDVAIAPAEDGGYVLLGLSRACPELFEGIAWSSPEVMAQTRARLAEAGVAWHELPARWDVDRPEDYARLRREGLLPEVVS
jgi:uncharacterized protein